LGFDYEVCFKQPGKNETKKLHVFLEGLNRKFFSKIFGNYHHKISHFDRKNHKKKNREILEVLSNEPISKKIV